MLLVPICAALALLAGEPPKADPAQPADQPRPADVVVTTPYYTLRAASGLEADARLLASTLDLAIGRLAVDYAAAGADRLLRAAKVEILVAGAPNGKCGVGNAGIESGVWNGQYKATINILAPSAHPASDASAGSGTVTGEPYDVVYCQRVLVHEYGTVLLESIARDKGPGWTFFSAPSWFVQGAEEYLGLMYSTEHARKVTLRRYVQMTRAQGLVDNDFGFSVQSPYVAGPVLVAFLHERFGRDKFIELLRSTEPTFGKAVRKVTGTTPDAFFEAWQAWLAGQPAE